MLFGVTFGIEEPFGSAAEIGKSVVEARMVDGKSVGIEAPAFGIVGTGALVGKAVVAVVAVGIAVGVGMVGETAVAAV